ncbi:MAG TPA: FAD-dependent oxidoreductase [Steroidobacteraceae bacterium]|nr:FAD-dependent oxidoreductase [Steroidobacteraceae bacterium]
MRSDGIARDARILIVGAGAAGICTAWYLKLAGFRHVKVFEKSPRLGGKCRSLTVDGQSFDLGANYVTSAYARVRELAAHVGATMYTERAGHVIDVADDWKIRSILSEVLRRTSFPTLAWQSLRYLWKRWRIRKLLAPYKPGFGHVKDCPELQGSFEQWLRRHRLDALIEIFEIPLTLMGYGKLDGIAAAYALTYMSPLTFKDLSMFAANLPLRCWPKRFTQGYGRMFERLAAEVDVLTGATITKITRDDAIRVEYTLLEQDMEGDDTPGERATFDYLVLACPQVPGVLREFLTLTPAEERLFGQVVLNPFFVTTYEAPGTERVAAVTFSLDEPTVGQPFVVTRQYPESDFISVYTRGDHRQKISHEEVLAHNRRFLAGIGARDPDVEASTMDDWAYFPHVPVEAMDAGFFAELEALQGTNRTFYCGGLLAFELVETIAEYSHDLVRRHFVGKGTA